jgi:1-acyl-sn-glycerol-3-phosphate acyltransferase
MIPALILICTIVALAIPGAIIFIPLAMLTGNVGPLYVISNFIVRTSFLFSGIRVQVEGLERIPANTACIFMANHVSNLDPPTLIPVIPGRTAAFSKRSIMKIPALGYGMKLADFIPVDRKGNIESAQESIGAARRVIEKGLHITTFVEGTRSPNGRMLPFKKGPFYLAQQTGAPCIPVSIYGTETMMAKHSLKLHPGTAHVVFHDPISPADFASRDELSAAVRAAIGSGLPEWMRDGSGA